MFNLNNIFINNRKTFYNFATGEQKPLAKLVAIKIFFSMFLMIFFFDISKDFINIILTVYSILIGFSFNVMFYLLTISKNDVISAKSDSIEKNLKKNKVDKLSKELFYNVSYFNIITLALIILCLVYHIVDCRNFSYIVTYSSHLAQKLINQNASSHLLAFKDALKITLEIIFSFSLYFLLVETNYSFTRTIFRINFLFEHKFKDNN